MLGWIVRAALIVAGVAASWIVAKDEPIFGVIQMTIAVLLFALVVFILAFWPANWTFKSTRTGKLRQPPS